MATFRNKRELAALNGDNDEEHPRNNQARDTNVLRNQEDNITQVSENVLRNQEDNITQVSEEIEVRVTKKCPKSSVGHFGRPVQTRWVSSEPTSPDSFRTLSGEIPEFKLRTRKQMRILPRMILILKWLSLWVSLLQEFSPDKTSYNSEFFTIKNWKTSLMNEQLCSFQLWFSFLMLLYRNNMA